MQGMHSPSIGDPEVDAVGLAAFMHGMSQKPPLGRIPAAIRTAKAQIGLSPAAQAVASVMITHSEQGRTNDPQCSPEALVALCNLSIEDVVDGVDELEDLGLVNKMHSLGREHFAIAAPTARFFVALDPAFGEANPEQDARRIAADLVNGGERGGSSAQIAARYGWTPRRLNPALSYLVINGIVQGSAAIDQQFSYPFFMATPATRRFAREGNG